MTVVFSGRQRWKTFLEQVDKSKHMYTRTKLYSNFFLADKRSYFAFQFKLYFRMIQMKILSKICLVDPDQDISVVLLGEETGEHPHAQPCDHVPIMCRRRGSNQNRCGEGQSVNQPLGQPDSFSVSNVLQIPLNISPPGLQTIPSAGAL